MCKKAENKTTQCGVENRQSDIISHYISTNTIQTLAAAGQMDNSAYHVVCCFRSYSQRISTAIIGLSLPTSFANRTSGNKTPTVGWLPGLGSTDLTPSRPRGVNFCLGKHMYSSEAGVHHMQTKAWMVLKLQSVTDLVVIHCYPCYMNL